MLADGDHYITGGRNLGAAYFDLSKKYNKRDRDIYVIGASAKAAQAYFEDLWSSSEVSVGAYKPYPKKRQGQLEDDIAEMEGIVADARASENYDLAKEFPIELRDIEDKYVQFVHDAVEDEKVQTTEVLVRLTLDADESVLVQTPYVVPGKGLFKLMEVKEQQGVPVTYVTNSVKSTVNVIATAATERYKKRMLDYEPVVYFESTGTEMLHAKSMVYRAKSTDDGPPCWGSVGSYNIDPRSAHLNTETFVLVRDCEFADELETLIKDYAQDAIRLESRDDLAASKALKKEIPFSKRFQLALLKFLTPLYRSQI
jgi:putative cardiolipin synthase